MQKNKRIITVEPWTDDSVRVMTGRPYEYAIVYFVVGKDGELVICPPIGCRMTREEKEKVRSFFVLTRL